MLHFTLQEVNPLRKRLLLRPVSKHGSINFEFISAHQNVIYFASYAPGGGIKGYSEETNDVATAVYSAGRMWGVAWDPKEEQLYFSQDVGTSVIYSAKANGGVIAPVFSSSNCKYLFPFPHFVHFIEAK